MPASVARGCSTPLAGRDKLFSVNATISEIGENSSSGAQSQRRIVYSVKKKKLRKKKTKKAPAKKNVRSKKHKVLPNDSDLKLTSSTQTDEPSKIILTRGSILSASRKRWHSADFALFRTFLSSTNANSTTESVQKDQEFIPRGINDTEEEPRRKRQRTDGIRSYPAPVRQSRTLFVPHYSNRNSDVTVASKYANSRREKFDTATSDMLWSHFVNNNPNTVGKYLENVANRLPIETNTFFKSRNPNRSKQNDDQQREVERRQTKDVHKRLVDKNIRIIRGYSTKETRRFTIVYDLDTTPC